MVVLLSRENVSNPETVCPTGSSTPATPVTGDDRCIVDDSTVDKTPQCPPGTTESTFTPGKCDAGAPTCPEGQKYQKTQNDCQGGGQPSSPTCPPNTSLNTDDTSDRCEADKTLQCPPPPPDNPNLESVAGTDTCAEFIDKQCPTGSNTNAAGQCENTTRPGRGPVRAT